MATLLELDDDRTAALFRFEEPAEGVRPSDARDNVADLGPPTGLIMPEVAEAPAARGAAPHQIGFARVWAAGAGLVGEEATAGAGALRLSRSMSIDALVRLDMTADTVRTIVRRGRHDATEPEKTLYELRLEVSAGVATVVLAWERAIGGLLASVSTAIPARFINGASTAAWVLVSAVRRWISPSSVEVDFYANGERLGTVASSTGEIAAGTSTGAEDGELLVGATYSGGTYSSGMEEDDALALLRISSDERTAEEVAHLYRVLFDYPREGGELVRAFAPPSKAFSNDPAKVRERYFDLLGDALAVGVGLFREMEGQYIPDGATRMLADWERTVGLSPRPSDTWATRRARVLASLRKVHGYTRDEILEALEGPLAADAEDLEILENTNRLVDPFDGVTLGARWTSHANNGTLTVAAGAAALAFQAGDDARWDASSALGVGARTSIGEAEGAEIVAELTAYSLPAAGDFTGVYAYDAVSGSVHHFGLVRGGGGVVFGQQLVKAGVVTATAYAAPPGGSLWLRMKLLGDGTADLGYSQTSSRGPWTSVAAGTPSLGAPAWAGIVAFNGVASSVAGGSGTYASFDLWQPNWLGVFQWYVYRDPVIGGSPDLDGADAVIRQMRPAHTQGAVVASDSWLTEDDLSLTEATPTAGG